MRFAVTLAFVVSAAAFAQEGGNIALGVGTQKVMNIPGIQRIAVGDASIADVKTIGNNQVLIIGAGEGKTTLLIWKASGQRVSYTVSVRDAESPGDLWLAKPGFVARYSRYLADDWCQLAGVRTWAGDPGQLLERAESEQVALWRLPEVEVWFQNVDAALWRFAAREPALVRRTTDHLSSRSDLRVSRLRLE